MSAKKTGIMARLFGFGKKDKAPTAQEGIQRLREVEEMLMKKSDFLEKKIETELAIAKKNGTKNKRVALQALKRKKRYEKQLQQIDGTLSTIEYQREALEGSSTNVEVLKVMGIASKALEKVHSDLDVDKVHELMDQVAEQHEIAKEIDEAISTPVFGQDVDDDALLAELEEMEEEDVRLKLTDVGGTVPDVLPAVPSEEPFSSKRPVAHKQDDDDMRELAAWAS